MPDLSFLLSVRESLNFVDLVSLDPFQYFCTLNYLISCMYVTLVSSCVKIVSVKVYLDFDLISIKTCTHNGKTARFCMCLFFLLCEFWRNSVLRVCTSSSYENSILVVLFLIYPLLYTKLKSKFGCLLYKEKANRININADIKGRSHKYVELISKEFFFSRRNYSTK
jgi:hypothetical protein